MAQSGYTPILIYASGTATNIPAAGDLISGSSGAELAINYADGKLYYKDGSGNVKLLSIGYGSSSVTPTNGGVQYGTGTALALTAAGSSGQILRSNGAAAPTWADLSTLGVNTISFGTTGLTPNSATAGAVTVAGTLVTANGGTGLGGATPFTANGVLYASSASALTSGSALTFDGSSQFKVSIASATSGASLVSSGNFGVRLGANSTNGALIEGVDNTGAASYQPLYIGGSDLRFTNSGTEQMRLTSTGLGIGTSSPSAPLVVNKTGWAYSGNAYLTGVFTDGSGNKGVAVGYDNTSQTGIIYPFTTSAASSLSFWTYPGSGSITERMRLDSSGNLGLGVTPSAWSGFRAMQIGGTTSLWSTTSGNGSSFYTNNGYFNGSSRIYLTSGYATEYIQGQGQHIWYTAPSGTAGNAITFTQAMTLDASGNLLVGKTSTALGTAGVEAQPVGYFAVTRAERPLVLNRLTTDGDLIELYRDSVSKATLGITSNALTFGVAGSERARIDSSGNLGLGVTPSASNTYPTFELANIGAVGFKGQFGNFSANAYFNSGLWKYATSTGRALLHQFDDGAYKWFTAGSGTAGNAISFTQAMTLDASGNLQIGTTTNKTTAWSGNGTGMTIGGALAPTIAVWDTSNSSYVGSMTQVDADMYLTNTANGVMVFNTNNTERARITSGGALLVNCTAVAGAELFNVTGGISGSELIRFYASHATNPYGQSIIYTTADPNGTANEFFACYGGGTTIRASIRSNGGIANYSANDVNLSDRREKTNFAPAKSYLDTICAIPVQTFNYIDQSEDDPGLTLGVVAQDVQAVAPELVMESNWGTEENPKMRLSIYQTDLQYALMKCIQEQQALITSLTARVALLEGN